MKALFLCCFLLFQAPGALPTSTSLAPPSQSRTQDAASAPGSSSASGVAADGAQVPTQPTPPLEPWPGTVAEAFAAIEKHAQEKQFESARLIADRLLAPNAFLRWKSEQETRGGWRKNIVRVAQPTIDWLALDGLDSNARGEVWFARGVVDALAQLRPEAESDFHAARAASNDRSLRHDAIYDIGVLALEEGEEIRATLPEISGKPPAPPLPIPPAPAVAGVAQKEPPDPLQLARAAYLKAREHFVERLKSDWRDDDTRANVELCLKRLKELDEIEKKREEEKKKQEDQQKKDQEQKQDQKKPDDQKSEKDPNSKDDKSDSKDEEKPKDPKPEDEKDPKKPEEKPADDKKDPAQQDEKKNAPEVDPKEAQMSPEEMTQLLDRLQRLEDEAKKIQAQLKAARRGKVKKDW